MKGATLVLIRPGSNSLPAKEIPVFISTRLDLYSSNPNRIDVNGELSHVEIGGLNLTGTLKAIDLFN